MNNNTVSSDDLEELHALLRLFLSDSMNKVNHIHDHHFFRSFHLRPVLPLRP